MPDTSQEGGVLPRDNSGEPQAGETSHLIIGQVRTCDACSEDGVIVRIEPDTEAYICQRCDDEHEGAVNAGALLLAAELGHTLQAIGPNPLAAPNTLRMARLVIDAYNTYYDDAERSTP